MPGTGALTITGFEPTVIIAPLRGTSRSSSRLKGAQLLAEIRQNPPTTDEAVRVAAERLRHYVLDAQPGEYFVAPRQATVVHRPAATPVSPSEPIRGEPNPSADDS